MKNGVGVVFILGMSMLFMACADLREETNSSGWQFRPAPDAPPSWENDYGRPPFGGEGQTPFN